MANCFLLSWGGSEPENKYQVHASCRGLTLWLSGTCAECAIASVLCILLDLQNSLESWNLSMYSTLIKRSCSCVKHCKARYKNIRLLEFLVHGVSQPFSAALVRFKQ